MFSSKKQIRELQNRISELETRLRQQEAANDEECAALKYQQEIYQKKTQSLDALLEEMQKKKIDVETELARQKKVETEQLKQRLTEERDRTQKDITDRVRAFSDSYNRYLSQLRLMMSILTGAAEKAGAEFLQSDDADAGHMLQTIVSDDLQRALAKDAGTSSAPLAGSAAAVSAEDKAAAGKIGGTASATSWGTQA